MTSNVRRPRIGARQVAHATAGIGQHHPSQHEEYSAVQVNSGAFCGSRMDLVDCEENEKPEVFRSRRQPSSSQAGRGTRASTNSDRGTATGNGRGRGSGGRTRAVVTAQKHTGEKVLQPHMGPEIPSESRKGTNNVLPTGNRNTNSRPAAGKPSGVSNDSPCCGSKRDFTSKRLEPKKKADPFSSKPVAPGTFREAYNRAFPARIQHGGSGINKLQWDVPLATVDYKRLLPIVTKGIQETTHPYAFVARQTFTDMLEAFPGRVHPVLPEIVRPLKEALMSNDDDAFGGGLKALGELAVAVGAELNKYLANLLVPLSRRINRAAWRDRIEEVLQLVEESCGPDSVKIIKSKVPTYTSVLL